jgi:hypothetical protein
MYGWFVKEIERFVGVYGENEFWEKCEKMRLQFWIHCLSYLLLQFCFNPTHVHFLGNGFLFLKFIFFTCIFISISFYSFCLLICFIHFIGLIIIFSIIKFQCKFCSCHPKRKIKSSLPQCLLKYQNLMWSDINFVPTTHYIWLISPLHTLVSETLCTRPG